MAPEPLAFVSLNVHKDSISAAIAAAGRGGEVRSLGTVANTPEALGKLEWRLAARHGMYMGNCADHQGPECSERRDGDQPGGPNT